MTALGEFLFPAPAQRTLGGIVRWWEARRLRFNLIVGAAGTLSVGVVSIVTSLPPRAHSAGFEPGIILVVGVLANVCYSFGAAAEVAVEKLFGRKVLPLGPSLFRMGLTFSTGLMLLPSLLVMFDWGYRILRTIL